MCACILTLGFVLMTSALCDVHKNQHLSATLLIIPAIRCRNGPALQPDVTLGLSWISRGRRISPSTCPRPLEIPNWCNQGISYGTWRTGKFARWIVSRETHSHQRPSHACSPQSKIEAPPQLEWSCSWFYREGCLPTLHSERPYYCRCQTIVQIECGQTQPTDRRFLGSFRSIETTWRMYLNQNLSKSKHSAQITKRKPWDPAPAASTSNAYRYASVKCNDLFCLFHLLSLIFVLNLDLQLLWELCSRLEDGIMWRLTLHGFIVRIGIFGTLVRQNSQIHQINSCGDLRRPQTNPCRFSLRLSNPLYSYTPWLQCKIHQQQTITAIYKRKC